MKFPGTYETARWDPGPEVGVADWRSLLIWLTEFDPNLLR